MDLTVRVKPGSSKGPLVEGGGAAGSGATGTSTRGDASDELTVYLNERAVDGAANDALIKVLAKHLGVSKSRVEIVRGHTSRVKQVRIDD